MQTITVMCDADGVATAKVMATKDGRELAFCGHHGDSHAVTLLADGWELTAIEDPFDAPTSEPDENGTAVPVTVVNGDYSDAADEPDDPDSHYQTGE